MAARFLLAILAFGIGSLTPTLPDQLVPATEHKVRCCADVNMVGGQRCPLNPTGNSSTSGSTCCVSPSTCVPLHADSGEKFGTFAEAIGRILVNDDCVSTRTQRPSVPPPRVQFA